MSQKSSFPFVFCLGVASIGTAGFASGCARARQAGGMPWGGPARARADASVAIPSAVVAAAIPEGPAVADARENSENGDDEDEVIEAAGTLELGREVVRSCAEISAMSARNAEDDGALEAIRSLGKCMNRGALRGSRLQIAGGGRATRLFREAMGRAGVSKDRVEVVLCHADDMDRRVQVNLPAKGAFAPAQGQRVLSAADVALTLSVKKSQIVGFIMGGSLDD